MATAEDSTDICPDLIEGEAETTISNTRRLIALEAAWEIESLCIALRDAASQSESPALVVRGITIRMQELSGAIMGAISDTGTSTATLSRKVLREVPAEATS